MARGTLPSPFLSALSNTITVDLITHTVPPTLLSLTDLVRHWEFLKGKLGLREREVCSKIRKGNNIMVQEVGSLYGSTMDALNMEILNEGRTSLAVIDMSIITIMFGNSYFILTMCFDNCAKYENLTDMK